LPHRLPSKLLALAASILVAIGIGVVVYEVKSSPGHDQLAVDFAQYLNEFSQRPGAAQQIFLAKYDGRPVTIQEATNVLGYEPLAAKGLPPDYSIEEVNLLDMPCCKCAQIVCKNKQGQTFAIFEHATDQPTWFGDRPAIKCMCQNTPTSVVQLGDRLAVTWKSGKRYITVIGAGDLEEVTSLVKFFGGPGIGDS